MKPVFTAAELVADVAIADGLIEVGALGVVRRYKLAPRHAAAEVPIALFIAAEPMKVVVMSLDVVLGAIVGLFAVVDGDVGVTYGVLPIQEKSALQTTCNRPVATRHQRKSASDVRMGNVGFVSFRFGGLSGH